MLGKSISQNDNKQNKKNMMQEEHKSEFEVDKKYRKY